MAKKQQVTFRTIAEELGVSVSTVSRILSGQGGKYRIGKRTEKAVRMKRLTWKHSMGFSLDLVTRRVIRIGSKLLLKRRKRPTATGAHRMGVVIPCGTEEVLIVSDKTEG